VLAVTLAATASGARSAEPAQLAAQIDRETSAIRIYSHELGEDLKLVSQACGDARLSRRDPDADEKNAFLARTIKLVEKGLSHDFDPVVAAGGEYTRLERQLDAAAATTRGVRAHRLERASLLLERARQARLEEAKAVRGVLAANAGFDCDNSGLQQHEFNYQGSAEAIEAEVVSTVRFAGKGSTTTPRKTRPLHYRISVTYTVTYSEKQTLGVDDTGAGFCSDSGQEHASLTETATFPPITVLPNGRFEQAPLRSAPAKIDGSWTASGTYHQENQCDDAAHSFTCGGKIERESGSSGTAGLLVAPRGTLASVGVALPETHEGSAGSCPDPSDVSAGVPAPLEFTALAQHAASFHFPLDGIALRERLDPLTIESGIVHDGDPLPPLDCHQEFVPTCTTAGSTVHDLVRIEPVESG
jgi:hypothetical protein